MKIKQLKQLINDYEQQGKICDETEVIVNGEYCFGTSVNRCSVYEMAHVDEKEIVSDLAPTFNILIDHYLYECEDVGCCDMWLCDDDIKVFKEEIMNED